MKNRSWAKVKPTTITAGVPKIVSETSGTEFVQDIVAKAGIKQSLPEVQVVYGYSSEYWCGWIIAYYQWYTNRTVTCRSFAKIRKNK